MAMDHNTTGEGDSTPAGTLAGTQPANSSSSRTAASVAPALFGGHRGGGKKRADGLPAGSEEAKAADREKNRLRMQRTREAKRSAAVPAPLPAASAMAVATAVPDPGATLGGGESALSDPSPGVAGPLVVPWSVRLLEKPARLITRIIDRLRVGSLRKKLEAAPLPVEVKKEVAHDLEWKDQAKADFATCLADCAVIELNKRRVPGSDCAHWINLTICGGELALAHFDVVERLDKLIAATNTNEFKDKASA